MREGRRIALNDMRKNLFLHFMNRDSREIFGLFEFQNNNDHYRILRRALNASILLCEDYCIMPPGFLLEDDIAFQLGEAQRTYLQARLLQFPMREKSLGEYAEKKRIDYHPMRDRYSGLFSDTRLDFLGRHASGLIPRKSHITEEIAREWEAGPDVKKSPVWKPIRKIWPPKKLDLIREIPQTLTERGTAVTWSAIAPHLPAGPIEGAPKLRDALQHTYFAQYCREFDLVVLAEIPHMVDEFHLPMSRRCYSYRRFEAFLQCLGLDSFLFDADAAIIDDLKRRRGVIRVVDAFCQFAVTCDSVADLQAGIGDVAAQSSFDFKGFATRSNILIQAPTEFEVLELDDALGEVGEQLSTRYGLETRKVAEPMKAGAIKVETDMSDLVLFVALEEELQVLCDEFGLARNATPPAATGKIGDLQIAVLCPREMGRVPAAIETSRYLSARGQRLPKLILIVGLAGGFPEENTKPGHIICADTVVDLANRKVIDGANAVATAKFRRKDFSLDDSLWRLLGSDDFKKDEWERASIKAANWPSDRRPSLHRGKICSADEVVASDDWRKKILDHTEKLLGVEMEAGGVCAAASAHKTPVCMLRAVSDNADPSKADDEWRRRGMLTVAQVIKHLPLPRLLELATS